MPTSFWNPNAANVAQVDSLTAAGVPAAGNTISATINGKSVTYTLVSGDTTATAIAALLLLLQNTSNTPPEFQEETWSAGSTNTVILGTSKVLGRPFTLTASATGGGITLTRASVTANSSSSDVNNAANWLRSGVASLPQNGDDVVVADSSVSLLYNLSSLSAVTFASFTRWQSFQGTIGLPEQNPAGYVEYRPTYFKFSGNASPITVLLGQGTTGNGPTRERYDVGANQVNLIVAAAGSAADDWNVRFLGTSAANTIAVFNGVSVGVAMLPAETANFATATVEGNATLALGPGVTVATSVTVDGAKGVFTITMPTLVLQNGAQAIVDSVGGSAFTTVTAKGGSRLTWNSNTSITTLNLQTSSVFDKSGDTRGITVTNSTQDADTTLVNDPWNAITWTNAITCSNAITGGPFVNAAGRSVKIT